MEQQNTSVPDNNTVVGATSIDAFLNEVAQPTNIAPGTVAPTEPPPVYNIPATPPPSPEPVTPRNPDEPYFKPEDTQADKDDQPDNDAEPVTESYDKQRKKVRWLLTGLDVVEANILAFVAMTDDKKQFRDSDNDTEDLLDTLTAYYDRILSVIPAWIPFIMVFFGLQFDKVRRAIKLRRTAKANAAAKNNPALVNKVQAAAATEGDKPRTNFKINKKGEYIYDRYGKYLKADEPRELADIADIDRILESNKPSDVQAAFGLTDEQMKQHGIDI